MSKRHSDALIITDPGACNPSGVAMAIHEACREVIGEDGDTSTVCRDPAVRLMVYQLALLCGVQADLANYGTLRLVCLDRDWRDLVGEVAAE